MKIKNRWDKDFKTIFFISAIV